MTYPPDDDFDEDEEFDDPFDDLDTDEGIERYYQSTLVDRKCQGCGHVFQGRPDHGYCDPCADIIELGGEYPEYEGDDE